MGGHRDIAVGAAPRTLDVIERALFDDPPLELGRFEILRCLGRGGMGVVYLAMDPTLKREVAVKLHHGGSLESGERRLRREAESLAHLRHRNVVTVHEVGCSDTGELFIVMEYIPGPTLRAWVHSESPTPKQLLSVFARCAEGLHAAHRVGLVHRDFKPDNVIIDRDGEPIIIDFGLAMAGAERAPSTEGASEDDSSSKDDVVVGTPRYMAPELTRGGNPSSASDQFALCVSLLELLVGVAPSRPVLAPAERPAGVGRQTWAALLRGLAHQPEDRWPSLAAFAEALGRETFVRRHRTHLAASAFVTVAALGALGGAARVDRCSGGRERIEQVWNEARKREIAAAFESTGLSYAGQTWERMRLLADAQTEIFVTQSRDACEATLVRGDQSEEMRARRVACLDEWLGRFEASTEIWARADANIVESAIAALSALPDLGRCGDPNKLDAIVTPADAARGVELVAVRGQLHRADALVDAGRLDEARQVAHAVLDTAFGSDRALRARAEAALGKAESKAGKYEDAAGWMRQAYLSAVAAGHDGLAVDAATQLSFIHGSKLAQHAEAHHWDDVATATLARLGGDAAREAMLSSWRGSTLRSAGEYERAEAALRLAIRQFEQLAERELDLARAREALATVLRRRGNFEEAVRELESVVEIRTRALGSEHPHVGIALNNLGNALSSAARHEDARVAFERALGILRLAHLEPHPDVSMVLNNLGTGHLREGRAEEARMVFTEALDIRRATLGEAHAEVGVTLVNLGSTALYSGQIDQAEAHLRAGLDVFEAALGPEHVYVGNTLLNLSTVLRVRADFSGALELLDRAEPILVSQLTSQHPELALHKTAKADLRLQLGDFDGALRDRRAAVEIWQATVGPRHPDTAIGLAELAQGHLAVGERERARALLEEAVEILEHAEANPTRAAEVRFALAKLLPRSTRATELARAALAAKPDGVGSDAEPWQAISTWLRARAH